MMTNNSEPYVLVFGMSIYDIFGFTNSSFRPYDSNPGTVKVSFGGVCRNISENMARIGMNTKFISVVGDDEKGRSILEYAKKINIDMSDSLIVKGESTPTYLAILDETGEMVSAVVDLKTADCITTEFMDSKAQVIQNADYMVLDTDNPTLVEHIVKTYNGATNFILDPVSAAKAVHVKHLIPYFHTIKPNRHEAEVLCGFQITNEADVKKAGRYFINIGVKKVFITLDADGIYYNDGVDEGIIKANDANVVNVTGAGDSFVAGIVYGYMNNLTIIDTVKYAIAMSFITISHEETIHPDMSHDYVVECLKNCKWSMSTKVTV
ncbi:MAG: carbohydrate kinase family protein [Bacillaceae bacterium]